MAKSIYNPGFGPPRLPKLLERGERELFQMGREAVIRNLKISIAPARGFLARAGAKGSEVVLVLGWEFHGVSKCK